MAQAPVSTTMERSVQTTNSWIHDIEQRLDVDLDKATMVLGAAWE